MILTWIIVVCLVASVGSILTAGMVLIIKEKIRNQIISLLIYYATGVLLGAAFLGLIPCAIAQKGATGILFFVLLGIILFFVLEKILLWRHCHKSNCDIHGQSGPLIIFGDGLHNFIDGILIASAFSISIPVGIITGVAIIAHETPQELGDFAILLDYGYSKSKALFYNILSGLSMIIGALIGYFFLAIIQNAIPYITALAAASFIYIAMVDLIPILHRKINFSAIINQLILITLGIVTIYYLHGWIHHYHHH